MIARRRYNSWNFTRHILKGSVLPVDEGKEWLPIALCTFHLFVIQQKDLDATSASEIASFETKSRRKNSFLVSRN